MIFYPLHNPAYIYAFYYPVLKDVGIYPALKMMVYYPAIEYAVISFNQPVILFSHNICLGNTFIKDYYKRFGEDSHGQEDLHIQAYHFCMLQGIHNPGYYQ